MTRRHGDAHFEERREQPNDGGPLGYMLVANALIWGAVLYQYLA